MTMRIFSLLIDFPTSTARRDRDARRVLLQTWLLVIFLMATDLCGEEPLRVVITDPLPYRSMPVNYFGDESDDVVARLKHRLAAGEATLTQREPAGYLLDLLKILEIPLESQSLVFSKTSVHQRLISPKKPRAIYFNDDASVGWVPGAPVLEIAAQDPVKGTMFYTLAQPGPGEDDINKTIELQREERCITCHVSTATLNVPGHLLRSFVVNDRGEPQNGFSPVTQATPFERRWGGWYVTGEADRVVHLGNLFGPKDAVQHEQDASFRGTVTDLSPLVDLTSYPSTNSDIVALLVLQHQLQFYNLVTRVQFEHQFDRHSDAEERLASYALMEDEANLPGPVKGSTEYPKWYQSIGSRDANGRSLRDLDLITKLFRHGLSPLVRSRSFQHLPSDVKARLWSRFREARGDVAE
jgi:hypothetical protein